MRSVVSFACCLLVAACASMHDDVVPDDKSGSESQTDRPWSDTIRPDVLAVMRSQEAMQLAVQVLYEQYVRAPSSGSAGLALEGDGLTLYYQGDLTTEMPAALATARRVTPVAVKVAAFLTAELKADGAAVDAAVKSRGVSDIQRVSFLYDGSGLEVERMPAAEAAKLAAARNGGGQDRRFLEGRLSREQAIAAG